MRGRWRWWGGGGEVLGEMKRMVQEGSEGFWRFGAGAGGADGDCGGVHAV